MSEVKRESGRRISFLTAAKSMDRAFVGLASRLMQSSASFFLCHLSSMARLIRLCPTVPVARAQDYAFAGKGTIKLSESDPSVLVGEGTNFTKDFEKSRSQVLLPRNLGSSTAEVVEVISDTELRLKKEFNKKATEGLRERTDGSSFKVRTPLSLCGFSCPPHGH